MTTRLFWNTWWTGTAYFTSRLTFDRCSWEASIRVNSSHMHGTAVCSFLKKGKGFFMFRIARGGPCRTGWQWVQMLECPVALSNLSSHGHFPAKARISALFVAVNNHESQWSLDNYSPLFMKPQNALPLFNINNFDWGPFDCFMMTPRPNS